MISLQLIFDSFLTSDRLLLDLLIIDFLAKGFATKVHYFFNFFQTLIGRVCKKKMTHFWNL